MPTKPPKVSIVTRTYNRPLMLKRSIKDVLNQTYENWELIIVNDAGDKKAFEEVKKEFSSHKLFKQIKWFTNSKNLGRDKSANVGFSKATGKYIVMHDDDDTWHKDFLKTTVNYLENRPAPSIKGVATLSMMIYEKLNEDGSTVEVFKEPFRKKEDLKSIYLYDEMYLPNIVPISFVYERAVWVELGGFREDLPVLEDWDFNIRFLEKYDIGLIREYLAFYHIRHEEKAEYGNSITVEVDKHYIQASILRNQLLREDLKKGVIGKGFLVNHVRKQVEIENRIKRAESDIKELNNVRQSLEENLQIIKDLQNQTLHNVSLLNKFKRFLKRKS